MPGTASYSGSNVDSDYIFDVSVALSNLQDNTSELIDPKDIRDPVWTLWNRLDDVQILASQSSALVSSSSYFTNTNPTTVTVGGVTAGTTFPGTYSIQQMFDLLLYPYSAPILGFTASGTPRQFGGSVASTLSWHVTKKSNAITSITVDGNSVVPSGASEQSGTISINATHSVGYSSLVSQTQTFTMSVNDGTVNTKTTSISWRHRIYWGIVDLSGISSPNLTENPGLSPSVGAECTDAIVTGLTGAGISPGSALATTYARSYNGINGGGRYLLFAHPTVFGASPTFYVNGLPNTAFTKVRSNDDLLTDTGIIVKYDVWISNTAQNSPIDKLEIT